MAAQNIEGTLTLTKDAIFFDPNLFNEPDFQETQTQTKLKYNMCISVKDINEAVYYVIPN
jgi:hypothetical protein